MKRLIVVTNRPQDSLFFFTLKTFVQGYVHDCTCFDISLIKTSNTTLDAGYVAEQVVLQEEKNGAPKEAICLVFVDSHTSHMGPGVILKLDSGMTVVGPNDGNTLSFVKPYVEKSYAYAPLQNLTVRKGLHEYGRVVSHLMDYEEEEMELEDQSMETIHDIHGYYVCHQPVEHIYHTNMPKSALKGTTLGDSIKISIDKKEMSGTYVDVVEEKDGLLLMTGEYGHEDDPYIKIYSSKPLTIGSVIEVL